MNKDGDDPNRWQPNPGLMALMLVAFVILALGSLFVSIFL